MPLSPAQRAAIFGSMKTASDPHALPGGDYSGALVVDVHPGAWWQDAGKTTAAGAGDPIHTWADAEATYDATQSTGAAQPLVEASATFNGYLGVDFDGTDDTMSTAAFAAELTQPFTLAVVFNHTGANRRLINSNSVTTPYIEQRFTGTGVRYFGGSSVQDYTGFSGVSVAIGIFNGASSQFLDAAGSWNNVDIGSANFDRLNLRPLVAPIGTATICRALVIDAALDSSARDALRDFLNSTYAP